MSLPWCCPPNAVPYDLFYEQTTCHPISLPTSEQEFLPKSPDLTVWAGGSFELSALQPMHWDGAAPQPSGGIMDRGWPLHYEFLIYQNIAEWTNVTVYYSISSSSRASEYSSACLNTAWAITAAEGACRWESWETELSVTRPSSSKEFGTVPPNQLPESGSQALQDSHSLKHHTIIITLGSHFFFPVQVQTKVTARAAAGCRYTMTSIAWCWHTLRISLLPLSQGTVRFCRVYTWQWKRPGFVSLHPRATELAQGENAGSFTSNPEESSSFVTFLSPLLPEFTDWFWVVSSAGTAVVITWFPHLSFPGYHPWCRDGLRGKISALEQFTVQWFNNVCNIALMLLYPFSSSSYMAAHYSGSCNQWGFKRLSKTG